MLKNDEKTARKQDKTTHENTNGMKGVKKQKQFSFHSKPW